MNPTDLTLLEQMKVHAIEIARRKQLLGFDHQDARSLERCQPFITRELDDIVEAFYGKQTGVPEIALIIGDAETLQRLRSAQRRYIADLFTGRYDEAYVNNRLRIGMVHKRIGVEPKYYLAAMRVLKTLLFESIQRNLAGAPELDATIQALDKLLYLDNEFVFDTYIRSLLGEIEAAKDRAVEYARVLEDKVAERTRELEEASRRDSLTGLYNQGHFFDCLHREMARAQRTQRGLSLIYLDVDLFKQVNDAHGHLKGDQLLRTIALGLSAESRAYDICCRYGGDEFCMLLPETPLDDAARLGTRLLEHFKRAGIGLSIGLAHSGPEKWFEAEALLALADARMYRAKAVGGSRLVAAEVSDDATAGPLMPRALSGDANLPERGAAF